jgi:hypothetical protein
MVVVHQTTAALVLVILTLLLQGAGMAVLTYRVFTDLEFCVPQFS